MGLWVGPAFHCPWLGKVGLWGAGAWHCCGIAGAGTDGSRELKWDPGPWQGWGRPEETGQGHSGLVMPLVC